MPDRADLHATGTPAGTSGASGADDARRRVAAARVRRLEELEGRLLGLAVQAPEDAAARWLEASADTAWRDAQAMVEEHELVPSHRLP